MNKEYQNFAEAMDKLLKVSHEDLKVHLDAEKRAKKKKLKSKTSASGRAGGGKD